MNSLYSSENCLQRRKTEKKNILTAFYVLYKRVELKISVSYLINHWNYENSYLQILRHTATAGEISWKPLQGYIFK